METSFTPLASFVGGAMIGLSAVALMTAFGRIAGISGLLGALVSGEALREGRWRLAFLGGLVLSPLAILAATGTLPTIEVPPSLPMLVGGGLLVGIGVHFGSGCTSGHGVCGLSRLSVRSLAAVATFMATAVVTLFVIRHVIGA